MLLPAVGISPYMREGRGFGGLIPRTSLSSSQTGLAPLRFFIWLRRNRRSCGLAPMDVSPSLETGFPAYHPLLRFFTELFKRDRAAALESSHTRAVHQQSPADDPFSLLNLVTSLLVRARQFP
jgi:hypothetical protein